jgi:hypothetical protein
MADSIFFFLRGSATSLEDISSILLGLHLFFSPKNGQYDLWVPFYFKDSTLKFSPREKYEANGK